MSILRSFLIQNGATEAHFIADVEEFLGVTAGPGGAVVLTLCRGHAEPNRPMLLGPTGLALPQRAGDQWHVYTMFDGQEPPTSAQPGPVSDVKFIGALAGQINGAATGVYFFARKAAPGNDA